MSLNPMKSPDNERFYEWDANPEPMKSTRDPRTILDSNIDGQTWLYNYEHESEEWLTYLGETVSIEA